MRNLNSWKEIENTVSISDLIGKYVKLKRLSDGNFIGACPFHTDKTPSFRVNEKKGFYKCFGCDEKGKIFTFLQNYKKIPFKEALKEICDTYNIHLQNNYKNTNQTNMERSKIDILREVKEIFINQLNASSNASAMRYLKEKRGLDIETIKRFELGYCPSNQDFLISYFPDKVDVLLEIGVLNKSGSGNHFSTFANRIIFPIENSKGETIGFGGRIWEKEQEEKKFIKYINSKESENFKKGRLIYGLELVKAEKPLNIIITEGYFDCIKMHQAGFRTTVACMGTAISTEQLKTLFESTGEIIFCYDMDEAGRKAENRAIQICLPLLTNNKTISFIKLDNGSKDVDDFIMKFGHSKLNEVLEKRIKLHEKIFEDCANEIDFKNPVATSNLESKLTEYTDKIENKALKRHLNEHFKNLIKKRGFAALNSKTYESNNINQDTPSKISTLSEDIENLTKLIEERRQNKGSIGLPTTFYQLDNIIRGLNSPDLIVIAGRPSMGKTALALSISIKVAEYLKKQNRGHVIIFSLEMSKNQILTRMIAGISEISASASQIYDGDVPPDEKEKMNSAINLLKGFPILIDDSSAFTISTLRKRIEGISKAQKIELIIIDYLQFLRSNTKTENRTSAITEITAELKSIAKDFSVPVIALSQLSREVESRENKRPKLQDLRDSGSIEQDADIVMFIHREDYYLERERLGNNKWNNEDETKLKKCNGVAEIIVAKNRNGDIGTATLKFDKNNTTFHNMAKTIIL